MRYTADFITREVQMKIILLAIRLSMLCGIAGAALLASNQMAEAQDATPTSISDLGLDREAVFGLIRPKPRISWRATAGVDHFRLTATLQAARVNAADPFCSPPAQAGTTTITVDETLPGTATGFSVAFPPLTESDSWFVFNGEVGLDAVDSAGRQIGAQGGGRIAETLCGRPQPTATSAPLLALPSTGTGQTRDHVDASMIAAAAASFLLLLGIIPLTRVIR